MTEPHCNACDWTHHKLFTDPKLDRAEQRELDRAIRNRDQTQHHLKHLTDTILAELIRRNREPAQDAYTTPTAGGSNDISKPTEAVALRDAGSRTDEDTDTWPTTDDTIQTAITNILNQLAETNGITRHIDRSRAYVFAIGDRAAGRTTSISGQCQRCNTDVSGAVNDKLVSGYCPACRKAWERADYPDRHQFERSYQPPTTGRPRKTALTIHP